jgi:hypothetical protein
MNVILAIGNPGNLNCSVGGGPSRRISRSDRGFQAFGQIREGGKTAVLTHVIDARGNQRFQDAAISGLLWSRYDYEAFG